MKYQMYRHAADVPYADWKANGIKVPIFDKDGTLTHANKLDLVDEVVDGLAAAQLPDIFPDIAVVSNNHDHAHVEEFAAVLEKRLGVGVFAVSRAQGYKSKPDPEMGLVVAKQFDAKPGQLGVVGDRLFTDVKFAEKLGAGVVALCDKAGEGDARWVPILRKVEAGMTRAHRITGRAEIR